MTIPLCPEAKGNSREFGRTWRGKPILRKSPKATAFLDSAVAYLMIANPPAPPIEKWEKLVLMAFIRYPNYRRDVDGSLIKDALQRAGIIPNDRQIRTETFEADDAVGEPLITITLHRVGVLPWRRGK